MEEYRSSIRQIRNTAVAMAKDIGAWWREGKVELMAAAIAFYSMLSLAPLLAFAVSVAGLFMAQSVAKDQLLEEVAVILGQETADYLASVIAAAVRSDSYDPLFPILGLIVTVFFASTVFNSLRSALNTMWSVKGNSSPRSGVFALFWNRLLAAGMVILISLALTLTMLISAMTIDLPPWLAERWPYLEDALSLYRNTGVGVLVVVGLMMVAYKVLPDVSLTWRQVLPGALLVTALFALGNEVMKIYFSWSALPTVFGVAGSLVMVLLWIYYFSYIFFMGALITRAWVKYISRGSNPGVRAKGN